MVRGLIRFFHLSIKSQLNGLATPLIHLSTATPDWCLLSFFPECVSQSANQTFDQSQHAKQTTQAISLMQCATGLSIYLHYTLIVHSLVTWKTAGELFPACQSNSLPLWHSRPAFQKTKLAPKYRIEWIFICCTHEQCAKFVGTEFG